MGIHMQELLLILAIILLLFGAKKLPELAKGLGKGIRDFKSAMKDEPDGEKTEKKEEEKKIPPASS